MNPFEVTVIVPGRQVLKLGIPYGGTVATLKEYLRNLENNSDLATKTFQRAGVVLEDTTPLNSGDVLTTKTKAEGGLL